MPYIRYTRDKRGYETTYVVHSYRTSHEQGKNRVLYLFRSPSHLTMGRRALDDESRVALEHTHPDLSFDWQAIQRELASPRETPAKPAWREAREARQHSRSARQENGQGERPAPAPPQVVVDDQSILGRVLGAAEAMRLRSRYTDLMQRIARRARSPEERDQLTERARRLNPDDWSDEMAVRAGVSTFDAEWESLARALPARRRGRRGGRRRDGGPGEPGETTEQPSAIMTGGGDADDVAETGPDSSQVDRPGDDAGGAGGGSDDRGDGDRFGPAGAGDDLPDTD